MMKTDKNFRLSKKTKAVLSTLFGKERNTYKNIMIQSQIHAEKVKTQKPRNDKSTKPDAT